jgi:hypothetical protein
MQRWITCSGIIFAGKEKKAMMDSSMIRIVCAVLAVLFLGLIVLRRKKSAE